MKKPLFVIAFVFFFSFEYAFAFSNADSLQNGPGRDSSFSIQKITDVRSRFQEKSKYNYLDYIQNQNGSAQSAHFWIAGTGKIGSGVGSSVPVGSGFALAVDYGLAAVVGNKTIHMYLDGNSTTRLEGWDYGTMTPLDISLQKDGGNVGIGAMPGSYKLDVNGTSRFANDLLISKANTGDDRLLFSTTDWSIVRPQLSTELHYNSVGSHHWNIAGAEAMKINVFRNVLIGSTTDEGYKLDVNGSGRFAHFVYTNDRLLVDDGQGLFSLGNVLKIGHGASVERMRISGGGNVLIGTTTDVGYKLDVNGTIRIGSLSIDPSGANGVVFYNSASNQFKGYRNGQWKNFLMEGDPSSFSAPANQVIYGTGTGSASSSSLTFNNNTLEVGGSDGYGNIFLKNNTGLNSLITGANDGTLYLTAYGDMRLRTNQAYTTNMLLKSNGNVLIGTMTDQSEYKLQVEGNTYMTGLGIYSTSTVPASISSSNAAYSMLRMQNPSTYVDMGVIDGNYFGVRVNGEVKMSIATTGVTTFYNQLKLGNLPSYPASSNGGLFYNSSTNQFQGYRNGQWKNFLMEGDASSGASNGWTLAGNIIYNSSGVNVGIGTSDPGQYKLAVEGTVGVRKIKVTQASWADYVFHSNYKLPTLKEVEEFIKKNKHLPDVPSTKEVEQNGLDVGDNQATLLKKIEELTLYIIEQDKKIKSLELLNKELSDLKKDINALKVQLKNN